MVDFLDVIFNTWKYIPGADINIFNTLPVITDIINGCKEFFAVLIALTSDLEQIIELLPLPGPWLAAISIMITLLVCLRIYAFIKDIEILGFKL